MNKADRKLLLKNRLSFVENVEPNDLLGYLYQDGVISENDKEMIQVQTTRRDRIEHLLDLLPRKGPKTLDKFCNILNQSVRYQYLAKILRPLKYAEKSNGEDIVDGETPDDVEDNVVAGRPPELIKKHELSYSARRGSKPFLDAVNSYTLTSNPRGWCFIINNMHFFKQSDRDGSKKDAHNLQDLFTSLGFRVWLVNDVDTIDIREKFRELAQKTNHGDCLVVCILSHGLSGQIYGVEGQLISVSEILDILNDGPVALQLKSKPKLFLIQACRGSKPNDKKKREHVIDSSQVISAPNVSDLGQNNIERCTSAYRSFIEESMVQAYGDLILAYSTFPGEVSWRHTTNGSYFIDSVVDVFANYSSCEDVLSMFVKINQKVLEKLQKDGVEQIPAPVFTLTKKLYLFPP